MFSGQTPQTLPSTAASMTLRNESQFFWPLLLGPDEALSADNPERIGKGKNEIWAQIRPNKTELVRVI